MSIATGPAAREEHPSGDYLRTRAAETSLWHSQANMAEVKNAETVFVSGDGAYLTDQHGARVLDTPASLWYANIGHGRREIADAVRDQLATLETYNTFQSCANVPALELADRIVAMAPIPNAKVYLSSGGSDAVDTAGKLAWRYWNVVGRPSKRTFITRSGGYHGLHVFGTSIVGLPAQGAGYGITSNAVHADPRDAGSLQRVIDEQGADTIAAFFCEPVMGAGGVIPASREYLSEVQETCRRNDILFIVDEVICGFGRTGHMFASDRFGLTPDMMTTAKGLTSGYLPLGATIIGERVWTPFWEDGSSERFAHGLTYSGHAASCRAALVNLDILEREKLVERVLALEPVLWNTLSPLGDHELVEDVRGNVGLLCGVDILTAELANEVVRRGYERGMFLRLTGDGRTLQISPPFVITEQEIARLGEVLVDVLDELAAER
jgi:putrescine aminotransferase